MPFEYLIVRQFLNSLDCTALADRLDDFQSKGIVLQPDQLCPNSPAFYGAFNDEANLWLPTIEKLVGKQLYPTYTYSRIYVKNESLQVHTDRHACEYSITLALKYDEKIWPFWIETSKGPVEILLDIGDVLIYNGISVHHWRTPLEGRFHYQAFIHYVDKNGPYTAQRYDGRNEFQTTKQASETTLRKKNGTYRPNH